MVDYLGSSTLPAWQIMQDTTKTTYSASIRGLVPAATATDIFTISGSATKIIKIKRINITGSQTGNTVTPVSFIKRSTLDTLGTSTTLTNVSHDSNDVAATAVVKAYTVSPTLGTAIGAVVQTQITFNNGLASGLEDRLDWTSLPIAKPIVLNNINENLSINLNSTSVTAGSLNIFVVWTEE